MQCHQIMSQDWVYLHLEEEFRKKEYIPWRGKFLFHREQTFFPETMEDARLELERRNLQSECWALLRRKKSQLRRKKILDETLVARLETIRNELKKIRDQLNQNMGSSQSKNSTSGRRNRSAMIIPCPSFPKCKGFIGADHFSCGLCEIKVCSDCLDPISEKEKKKHVCWKEKKESARLILAETKACPKCAVRIYKVSGCDQMWCVRCHCTFSWETQKPILSGPVHNPHYYEWMADHAQHTHHQDFPAEFHDIMIAHFTQSTFRAETVQERVWRQDVFSLLQNYLHLQQVLLPRYYTDPLKTNKDLRLAYLINDKTQEDLERILYKRERMNLKKSKCYEVLQRFLEAIREICLEFVQSEGGWTAYPHFFENVQKTCEEYNTYFLEIGERYGKSNLPKVTILSR